MQPSITYKKTVPTPCIQVCKITPSTGLCEGCNRTRDEIARWGMMNNTERLSIMSELPRRKQRF
jgi:uncharacterized protein